MAWERGSGTGEAGPSSEQLAAERRAERDAYRADPDNWPRLDPANRPDRHLYQGESEPPTAEERARLKAFEGDESDGPWPESAESAGETARPGAERVGSSVAADQRRPVMIVIDGVDRSLEESLRLDWRDLGPGYTIHGGPVGEHSSGSSEASGAEARDSGDGEPAYRDPEDVREALLAGESVSDVRQELRNQPPDQSSETTTEPVREEGDHHYELGAAEPLDESDRLGAKLLESPTDEKALGEQVRNVLLKRADDVTDVGRKAGSIADGLLNPPTGRAETIQRDQPVVRPADSGIQGDHVAGLALLATVALVKGTEIAVDRYKGWMEKRNADR